MRWQDDNSWSGYIKLVVFLLFIMPILVIMTAWDRWGCSRYFEAPTPEPIKWDIEITHLDPNPVAIDNPWNAVLLAKLQGMWENNLVATVRGTIDEDVRISQDEAGSIVHFFDPPEPEPPKDAPINITIEFYRIQGTLRTGDGPSPKYVMVEKYKGKTTAAVVFAIEKGPRTVHDWKGMSWFKDQIRAMKELDKTYFQKTGLSVMGFSSGGGISKANAEDVVALMKIAESP